MREVNIIVGVMSDGNRANAELVGVDYDVNGKGSSAREPGDKPNREVGEDLALARALRSAANRLERRANGRLKHLADCRAHRQEIAANKNETPRGWPWATRVVIDAANSGAGGRGHLLWDDSGVPKD